MSDKARSATPFDQSYPYTARWVREHGWIEIGDDGMTPHFVKALDEGSLVWAGADAYRSIDEALQDLEAGLERWMNEQFGTSNPV